MCHLGRCTAIIPVGWIAGPDKSFATVPSCPGFVGDGLAKTYPFG